LGEIIHFIKKTEALVLARKVIFVEENADKTKYIVMYRVMNAGRSHRNTFEKVEQIKY
jgi:hypothetical protein